MKPNSYPPTPVEAWTAVDPRPLLSIYPPSEPLERPALPTKQRSPSFEAPYTLSTHIIPACYLRKGRFLPVPPSPPTNGVPKDEKARIMQQYKYDLRVARGAMLTDGYPKVLWNCLNRYARKGLNQSNKTGLTLFFAHANGFPKEIWEPTLATLLSSQASILIDEVWCWESIQHGDAALINRESISRYFDWSDNSRDMISFWTNFLPSETSSRVLPLHLPRVSEQETKRRLEVGFQSRKLMIVGHSYGGCTSTLATENYPHLVDSLILIDPVIAKPYASDSEVFQMSNAKTDALLMGSLTRRDTWKSREEVLTSYLRSPFFQAWHPDVLKIYIEAGIYDTTDAEGNSVVKLKMPGIYESIVFSERTVQLETWQNLANIPERIPLRWIVPGRSDADEFGPPGATGERCWSRPKNASNIRIAGAGHLIAQESPAEVGEDLRDFILEVYSDLYSQKSVARPNL
ncbi:Alpha/Beta hydrolase protein [Ephemerocybe angulata]|uniref:Alpha/Beta hydrolase protein n=1 Tax=Ephemerocybe angulata TaxID=980116 RepID=A0A8H6LYW2_9AGAR|nr:Alpha/Beta hydrolase protein [Tulosesus angulatus]